MGKGYGVIGWVGGSAAVVMAILAMGGCHGMSAASPPAPSGSLVQAPAAACADFTISIYFEPRSAAITREASALIDAAAAQTRGCDVQGVHVVGLADSPGSHDANLQLSRRRAEAATRAFHARGLNSVEFEMTAAGENGAPSGPGQSGPLRRQAQVTFHLAPKPAPPR